MPFPWEMDPLQTQAIGIPFTLAAQRLSSHADIACAGMLRAVHGVVRSCLEGRKSAQAVAYGVALAPPSVLRSSTFQSSIFRTPQQHSKADNEIAIDPRSTAPMSSHLFPFLCTIWSSCAPPLRSAPDQHACFHQCDSGRLTARLWDLPMET